jgi:hypothetical protein
MSDSQKRQFVLVGLLNGVSAFRHGDCRGADLEAAELVRCYLPQAEIIPHPPAPGDGGELARNRDIVAACDVLIAAPYANVETQRSGTWATVRYARASGKAVIMLSR